MENGSPSAATGAAAVQLGAIAAAEAGALTQLDILIGFDELSALTLEAELVAPAPALV